MPVAKSRLGNLFAKAYAADEEIHPKSTPSLRPQRLVRLRMTFPVWFFRVGSFLCTPLGLPSYLTFNTFSPSHRYVEIAFTAIAGAFAYGQLGPHLPHKTCSDFGSDS